MVIALDREREAAELCGRWKARRLHRKATLAHWAHLHRGCAVPAPSLIEYEFGDKMGNVEVGFLRLRAALRAVGKW